MTDRPLLRPLTLLSRASGSGLSVLLALFALPACTEFADEDDIAATMELLPGGGSGGLGMQGQDAPEWACLNGEPAAPPVALGDTTVTFTIFIADTVSRQPPAGLTVSACSPLDVECAAPMVDDIRPESDGMIRAHVPRNFSGFFRIVSDATVPAVLYVDRPVVENVTAAPMLLITPPALQALSSRQNIAIDPQMGHLLLRAFDCNGTPAPDIRFANDKGGQPFAFIASQPVLGQTATDAQGTGGYINVLPGLAVVESVRTVDGMITSTASGQVRAGWFTYLVLGARPT